MNPRILIALVAVFLWTQRPGAGSPAPESPGAGDDLGSAHDSPVMPTGSSSEPAGPLDGVGVDFNGNVEVSPAFVARHVTAACNAVAAGSATAEQIELLEAAEPWCAPDEVGGAWLQLPCDTVNATLAGLDSE